jgi:hypothetical protein
MAWIEGKQGVALRSWPHKPPWSRGVGHRGDDGGGVWRRRWRGRQEW